jgi:hypothetical protein
MVLLLQWLSSAVKLCCSLRLGEISSNVLKVQNSLSWLVGAGVVSVHDECSTRQGPTVTAAVIAA